MGADSCDSWATSFLDQFPDFDSRRDYALTITPTELTLVEQSAAGVASVDHIKLNL